MAKQEKKEKDIVLTPEETAAIESQRKDIEYLEVFRVEYQALVERTGFTWVIDATSPLNNLQLGIGRAPKQEQ
jgi:hypothetical protein